MILTKSYPASRNLNNVFDELFGAFPSTWGNDQKNNFSVPVNILESDSSFNLEFNVPGRKKEDFKINIDKGLLSVSFEKQESPENKEVKFLKREFTFQNFKRSFNLDEKINADGIEAKYENGILSISLPKKEEVKVTPK